MGECKGAEAVGLRRFSLQWGLSGRLWGRGARRVCGEVMGFGAEVLQVVVGAGLGMDGRL